MKTMRSGSRLTRWLSTALVLAVVAAGLLPAASAGAESGDRGGQSDRGGQNGREARAPEGSTGGGTASIEPALMGKVQANPGGRYHVIVQRTVPPSKAQARADEGDVENDVRAQGGEVGPRLGMIGGQVATLTGRQVLALARNRLVKNISLDHPVQVQQVAPLPLAPPAVPAALLSTWTQEANAPQAWATYGNRGAGVTVAVLDSGVSASPDLPNAAFGADMVTGLTGLGDQGGHATHVAGIIAGNGTLANGAYIGIAPEARIVSVKVTNNTGGASYSSIIQGLQWVVNNKAAYNIRVANLSLGAVASTGYMDDPLDAAVEIAWFRGIVVVTSAGNNGPGAATISVPANDPYVIAVGAFDDNQTALPTDDVIPFWSSQGPSPFDGFAKPDLAASGRRVVSLRVPGSFLDVLLPERVTATNYFRLSGTSMAAPVVAGVAALVIAQRPTLGPDQVKWILTHSTRAMPYAASSVGTGAVDALAAVGMAAAGTGIGRANVGLRANSKAAQALWPVMKSIKPVWRNPNYNGRSFVNGDWVGSGLQRADGTWNDGSWDTTAWSNFAWEDGSWDTARWLDGSWDTLVSTFSWSSSLWDTAPAVD